MVLPTCSPETWTLIPKRMNLVAAVGLLVRPVEAVEAVEALAEVVHHREERVELVQLEEAGRLSGCAWKRFTKTGYVIVDAGYQIRLAATMGASSRVAGLLVA